MQNLCRKEERLLSWKGNSLGTSLAAKDRTMMSPRFRVLCSDLKHGPGYRLAAGTNKSIKPFSRN